MDDDDDEEEEEEEEEDRGGTMTWCTIKGRSRRVCRSSVEALR